MLKRLELRNVGPASHLALNPVAPRFNFLTGDNGLGKSFLLEAAWWALTRTWHETPAVPNSPEASISYSFDGLGKPHAYTSRWDIKKQQWNRSSGRPPNPGLVIYARVDGSFSVWDPARNYVVWQRADGGNLESPPSYQFTTRSVLYGLRRTINLTGIAQEELICAGLIDDWTRWHDIKEKSHEYRMLCRLLEKLGPDDQPLTPGNPVAPYFGDQRRIPTIHMPYGQDVPITYAPAGVRRMTMLAYLLAWCFSEHQRACLHINQPLTSQIIVLIDEPETHLHPRWQRTVLPSLFQAINSWNNNSKAYQPVIQFIAATHAPLVMASMESIFDSTKDALWKLDLSGQSVTIEKDIFYKRGDVNRWLRSDVFDLAEATSREVEKAISKAAKLSSDAEPDCQEVKLTDKLLIKLLPEQDPFYARWRYLMSRYLEPMS
jgi:hypothetical protein